MNSMENFFNWMSKPVSKEDVVVWFNIHNMNYEKIELVPLCDKEVGKHWSGASLLQRIIKTLVWCLFATKNYEKTGLVPLCDKEL